MKLNNKKILNTDQGTFERGLETGQNIYFKNYSSGRNYRNSIMKFDRRMNLISSDNEAYQSFKKDVAEKNYSWMSEKLQKSLVDKN